MRLSTKARMAGAIIIVLCQVITHDAEAASPSPVRASNGMVVTAHKLASEVGVEVLERGGNAVDAAVAVGYALAVVYPSAGNIGGGGFMTLRLKDGTTTFLDFRERAPIASTKTMYLDANEHVVPGLSTSGYLAVGVPGSVMGFETALSRFGTMPRAALMAPAVKLAQTGFVLDTGDVLMLNSGADKLGQDPAAAAIFLNHGTPFTAGQRLVQVDLANSLSLISKYGPAVSHLKCIT